MSDHIPKRITKETVHEVQKQIIIIFHSKLKPDWSCKDFMLYRDVYNPSSMIPQNCQPHPISSRALFVSKKIPSKANHRSYKFGSTPYKSGTSNPLQNDFTLHVSYSCHTSYYKFKIKTTFKYLQASRSFR